MEHNHNHSHGANERRLFWAMLLTGLFMFAEVVGGLLSGSLALLADAGHMMTDFVSLGLAWFAFRLARRPADLKRSYGYHRFQVLAAFVNGLTLFVVVGWIVFEAIQRFTDPVEILAKPMLVVATLGLLVNIVAFAILHSGANNLNVRSAALHVVGDMLGSAAAIVASLIILWSGWTPIDPILSVFVAVLILRAAYAVVKQSGHILLEGTPENVNPEDLKEMLIAAIPAIAEVHHVHIWSLTSERPVITLHAVLNDDTDHNLVLAAIQTRLRDAFGISHATIQLESAKNRH